MLTKTGPGSGQKRLQADWAAHDFGQWFNTLPSLPPFGPNSTALNIGYFMVEPKDRL
jgi:hypothetical protein